AVAAMRLLHPEWRIGWAIEPRWRPLLEGTTEGKLTLPLVDVIHEVPTRDWNRRPVSLTTFREIMKLRRELRWEQYDLCVDMQGLFRSAVVGRLAGAAAFVGSLQPREIPARWLYQRSIQTRAAHVIDKGCELLGSAIGETLTAAAVPLPSDDTAERWCDELLAATLPDSTKRFVLVAPTAGWGAKCWPAEKFGAVAAMLAEAGYTVLVNAGAEDNPTASAVVEASGGRSVAVGCDLAQLTALLRRAALVVAGDTGPLHLAAALGTPVVALFGPTDPKRTGPYGVRSRVLRHASSVEDHRRHETPEDGLAQITVGEVTATALDLLQGGGIEIQSGVQISNRPEGAA
ncbi:MAG: glycosyltransferase family 9 protein, partial [Granulicella sp.]